MPLKTADETAEHMLTPLMKKLNIKSGEHVMLIINGVGATTLMELNIVYRKAHLLLEEAGCKVCEGRIAEILTVQEQAGFQMILARLDEDHCTYLKEKKSDAPYWTVIGK